MAEGKWLPHLKASTPLTEAAQQALLLRLQAVRERLPPVIHEPDKDPEHVHQLRVATRRADAALRIFRTCLPDRVYSSARKRVRRVRRAAGDARDRDVFAAEVVERLKDAPAGERPGLDFLAGYALGQRTAAQPELVEKAEALLEDFGDLVTDAVAAVRPGPDHAAGATLLALARPCLANLVYEVKDAAGQDLKDVAQLHQVRIAGKRLRYAMEVFAGCFPESFRAEVYPQVEQMQEVLGRVNDSRVALAQLTELRDRVKGGWIVAPTRVLGGVEGFLRFHQKRLTRERTAFIKWLDRWNEKGAPTLQAHLMAEPVT